MLRLTLLFFALMPATAASAQAPIERPTPPPLPPPQSLWPAPNDIPAGTHLLIDIFDGAHHPACILDTVDAYRLICAGPRRRPSAIYPRELIASIATVGPHYIPDHLAGIAVKSGLAIGGIGLFCGVDGGPTCQGPTVVGLSLIATGGVLAIVQRHQRKHPPQVLYLASYPPPTPLPWLLVCTRRTQGQRPVSYQPSPNGILIGRPLSDGEGRAG